MLHLLNLVAQFCVDFFAQANEYRPFIGIASINPTARCLAQFEQFDYMKPVSDDAIKAGRAVNTHRFRQ